VQEKPTYLYLAKFTSELGTADLVTRIVMLSYHLRLYVTRRFDRTCSAPSTFSASPTNSAKSIHQ